MGRYIKAAREAAKAKGIREDSRGEMVFHFGRHRGQLVNEVPEDYLEWVLTKCEFAPQELRDCISRYLYGKVLELASRARSPLTNKPTIPNRRNTHESVELAGRNYVQSNDGDCPFDADDDFEPGSEGLIEAALSEDDIPF